MEINYLTKCWTAFSPSIVATSNAPFRGRRGELCPRPVDHAGSGIRTSLLITTPSATTTVSATSTSADLADAKRRITKNVFGMHHPGSALLRPPV